MATQTEFSFGTPASSRIVDCRIHLSTTTSFSSFSTAKALLVFALFTRLVRLSTILSQHTMTAVNMHMPLDFLPHHSRSNSVSSSSTHSSLSRPQSSQGALPRMQAAGTEDLYRTTYHLPHHPSIHPDPVRPPFFSTLSSP